MRKNAQPPGPDNPLHLADDRILVVQLRLLLENVGGSVLPAVLLVALLLLVLRNESNSAQMTIWALATLLLKLFNFWDARRILAKAIPVGRARRLAWRLILFNVLYGSCWGALAWVTLDSATMVGSILVIASMAGNLNAAMILSPVFPVYVTFCACEIMILIIKLVQLGGATYDGLAFAAGLLAFTLIGQARNNAKAILASIILRFENLDLIDRLREEKANAESANRSKSVFLAAVSHDLRQPTHALGLFINTLQRISTTGQPPSPEKLQSLGGAMRASLSALSGLLHGILDISLLDSGEIKPNVKTVSLYPVMLRLKNRYIEDAAAKGLKLRCARTSLRAQTDEAMLERILGNLIENAIRYTEGGTHRGRTRPGCILIGCRRRGETIRISVYDTGIGIAEDLRGKAFEEFFQVGNAARQREHGVGLGLSIVKRSAQLLGHPIGLESELGRGSHFSITLPVATKAADGPVMTIVEPARIAAPVHRTHAIVVIDDERPILDALTTLLSGEGFFVIACTAVDKAADALQNHADSIRLIIADFRLEGSVTGDQAIRDARQRIGRDVPAIIITGDTSPERIREAKQSGFLLLHKPVDAEVLFAAMDSAMSLGA